MYKLYKFSCNYSDINGILICYKTGAIPIRLPPPVPGLSAQLPTNTTNGSTEIEKALNRLNLHNNSGAGQCQRNPKQPVGV